MTSPEKDAKLDSAAESKWGTLASHETFYMRWYVNFEHISCQICGWFIEVIDRASRVWSPLSVRWENEARLIVTKRRPLSVEKNEKWSNFNTNKKYRPKTNLFFAASPLLLLLTFVFSRQENVDFQMNGISDKFKVDDPNVVQVFFEDIKSTFFLELPAVKQNCIMLLELSKTWKNGAKLLFSRRVVSPIDPQRISLRLIGLAHSQKEA